MGLVTIVIAMMTTQELMSGDELLGGLLMISGVAIASRSLSNNSVTRKS